MSPVLGIIASSTQQGRGVAVGSYDSLATITVPSGGLASLTFAGIPTGYQHLQIRAIARNTVASTGAEGVAFVINGDTSASYAYQSLQTINVVNSGNPFTNAFASQTSVITGVSVEGGELANAFSANIIDVLDYRNVTKNKTFRTLYGMNTNGGTDVLGLRSGVWLKTDAITSLTLTNTNGSFAQHSFFALYGVK
jgi:hypothetical protein